MRILLNRGVNKAENRANAIVNASESHIKVNVESLV
jgi:hypothetical protein